MTEIKRPGGAWPVSVAIAEFRRVFGRYGVVDSIVPSENAARAVVYESFEVYFRFWPRDPFEVTIQGTPITTVGGAADSGSGPESARNAFQVLDTWCRARLPEDFLEGFEQALGPRHEVIDA